MGKELAATSRVCIMVLYHVMSYNVHLDDKCFIACPRAFILCRKFKSTPTCNTG